MAVLKSRNASTKITSLTEHTCVTVNESTTTTITATTTTAYITKYVCSATTFGSCFTYFYLLLYCFSFKELLQVTPRPQNYLSPNSRTFLCPAPNRRGH